MPEHAHGLLQLGKRDYVLRLPPQGIQEGVAAARASPAIEYHHGAGGRQRGDKRSPWRVVAPRAVHDEHHRSGARAPVSDPGAVRRGREPWSYATLDGGHCGPTAVLWKPPPRGPPRACVRPREGLADRAAPHCGQRHRTLAARRTRSRRPAETREVRPARSASRATNMGHSALGVGHHDHLRFPAKSSTGNLPTCRALAC
jgi:hypothetical protein